MLKFKRESFDYIKKLNPSKLINVLQVVASYYFSRIFRRPIVWGQPISLSIEPTTSCNLRCPECPSGLRSFTRPTGMLSFDLFKKLIDEQQRTLSYLLLYFQGEPFLNTKFLDMASYASGKGIYVATSTNAHYLDDENARKTVESGLDKLIISIDGTTQETYQQYRVGGQLAQVLEGTRNVIKWKKTLGSKTPLVVFQFLVVRPNEHQVDDVIKMAADMGVEVVNFKKAQLYDYENGNPLMPTKEVFSRYKKTKSGQYHLKNKLYNHCWKMWHSAVITWDGLVVPCCFDKDAEHQMGKITTNSFNDIYSNMGYSNFRKQILTNRKAIGMCKNCTEGTKIWI